MLRVTSLLLCLALAAAGCSGGSGTAEPSLGASISSPAPVSSAATTAPNPYPAASRLVRKYLAAAALRAPTVAHHMTSPDSARARRRLRGMERWLHQLAPSRLELYTSRYHTDDTNDRTGVRVQVRVRFGKRPLSHVVDAGEFVVDTSAGSVVGGRMLDPNNQLDAMRHPYTDRGSYGTVIYGERDLADEAAQLLAVAESEGPRLHGQFGGGRGIAQPVLVLAKSQAQLTKTCSCTPTENVLGLEKGGIVYVLLPAWRRSQEIVRQSVVVHELTHAATRHLFLNSDRVPLSLIEGIAEYEEQAYAGRQSYWASLDGLEAVYRRGYDSLSRWRSAEDMWGLHGAAIDLAYDDAYVITLMVVERHGGTAALRRLLSGFATDASIVNGPRRAQLDQVFRHATGATFTQVSAEAHAWVLARSWYNNPV